MKRPIEGVEELQRPGALSRALEELAGILAGGGSPREEGDRLADLAAPPVLDLLFRLLLARTLRGGPGEGLDPGGLVAAAARAAQRGLVPVATAADLRATVQEVEEGLHRLGAWDPGAPLWGGPLPEPGPLETLWNEFAGGGERHASAVPGLPEPAVLRAALGEGPGAPGWIGWRGAIPVPLRGRVHDELRRAGEEGALTLARGAVGREARRSERRRDAVAYVGGLEAPLLRHAPAAALLVQHLLERLEEPLRQALPERSLFAPQSVMLARYRAPCEGFAPHLDNPGGEADNGRSLTLILYLGAPDAPCRGGGLALWTPGVSTAEPPSAVLAPEPGSAILFDSRRVPHGVEPLDPGPDRWTLLVWLSERRRRSPRPLLPVPDVRPEEVFLAADDPPVPAGTVVLRRPGGSGTGREGGGTSESRRDAAGPGGARTGPEVPEGSEPGPARPGASSEGGPTLVVRRPFADGGADGGRDEPPRVGIVATVASAGPEVEAWCGYHLGLGVDRLIVILDEVPEGVVDGPAAGEGRRGVTHGEPAWAGSGSREGGVPRGADHGRGLERLRRIAGPERLTLWTAAEARERWEGLPEELQALRRHAEGGSAAWAVAARQALNASAALQAARSGDFDPEGEGRGEPLDWLLHLDADERFHPEGAARGGATLAEHFAAASGEGWSGVRYLNHELLAPCLPGEPPRFKRNPALAAERLGTTGWRRLVECLDMAQDARRPYFRAYWNGKSAVAVAAGRWAAGVHSWRVRHGEEVLLAGPSVLHLHLPTPEAFRRKYLRIADAPDDPGRPFPPSLLEREACALVRELRRAGAREDEVAARLDALYRSACTFSPEEVELLEAAALVFTSSESLWAPPDAPG